MVFWREKGLVLDLQFAEMQGNTVYDLSGNNNNGTIYGAQWKRGPLLGSLYFDGADDYVKIPNSTSLNPSFISVEVLVKFTKDTGNWVIVTEKGGPPKFMIAYYYPAPHWLFQIVTSDAVQHYINVYESIILGKWYHGVLTFDGNSLCAYINSAKKSCIAVTGTLETETYPLTIGIRSANLTSYPLAGEVALLRIYNRALSEDEIKAHYHYLMGYVNRIKRRFVG